VQRLDDARPACAAPDKAAVLAALPRAAVAHLACHGLFKSDQPAESGVVLRPTRVPDVLSVKELSGLDLTGLRHVTLSACWSADHFILPGRWVISLPETFARAGASSVLGCLWVVDDRVGTAFMAQFYRRLDGLPRAEALRRTQLACLRGELQVADAPDTTTPVFWAGYQLYGRGGALRL
jgi:CHAT domain-containing protein